MYIFFMVDLQKSKSVPWIPLKNDGQKVNSSRQAERGRERGRSSTEGERKKGERQREREREREEGEIEWLKMERVFYSEIRIDNRPGTQNLPDKPINPKVDSGRPAVLQTLAYTGSNTPSVSPRGIRTFIERFTFVSWLAIFFLFLLLLLLLLLLLFLLLLLLDCVRVA